MSFCASYLIAVIFLLGPSYSIAASGDCVVCSSSPHVQALGQDWPDQVYQFLAQQIRSEPGFAPIEMRKAPAGVLESAKSVFQIIVISAPSDGQETVLDLTADPDRAQWLEMKRAAEQGSKNPLVKVLLSQIENCEKVQNLRACVIHDSVTKGTAFVAQSGDSLWTNYHVISPNLDLLRKNENLTPEQIKTKGRALGFYLLDSQGNIIFDGLREKATLVLLPPAGLAASESDYVKIKISREIAAPLKISNDLQPDRATFTVGFPACTGCKDEENNPEDPTMFLDRGSNKNSSGVGMYVSTGRILPLNQATGFLGPAAFEVSQQPGFAQGTRNFYSSGDAVQGNSGGPIFDESGKVLMIADGGAGRMISGKLHRITQGVRPKELFGP
ncbi:MAG: trypsin-like peptidase domain-containing protein [Bacteriovoracia bacterium]